MVWQEIVAYCLLWIVALAIAPMRLTVRATFSLLDKALVLQARFGVLPVGVWRLGVIDGSLVVNGNEKHAKKHKKRKKAKQANTMGRLLPIGKALLARTHIGVDVALLLGLLSAHHTCWAVACCQALFPPDHCHTYMTDTQAAKGQAKLRWQFTVWDVVVGLFRAAKRATAHAPIGR